MQNYLILSFIQYLTEVDFVEVPLLPQCTDANVAVLPVQEQSLVNVVWRAFQLLPAQKRRKMCRVKNWTGYLTASHFWRRAAWTHLRGVSSMASSSSSSLSQSHRPFRFLFLHSHPCLRPVLVPSAASSGAWEEEWSLLPRPPILGLLVRRNTHAAGQIKCLATGLQGSIRKQNHENR